MGWSVFDVGCCCGGVADPCGDVYGDTHSYDWQFFEDFDADPPEFTVYEEVNRLGPLSMFDYGIAASDLFVEATWDGTPMGGTSRRIGVNVSAKKPLAAYFAITPYPRCQWITHELEFAFDTLGDEVRTLFLGSESNKGGVNSLDLTARYVTRDIFADDQSPTVQLHFNSGYWYLPAPLLNAGRFRLEFLLDVANPAANGKYDYVVTLLNAGGGIEWQEGNLTQPWQNGVVFGNPLNTLFKVDGPQVHGCRMLVYAVTQIELLTDVQGIARTYRNDHDDYSVNWSSMTA